MATGLAAHAAVVVACCTRLVHAGVYATSARSPRTGACSSCARVSNRTGLVQAGVYCASTRSPDTCACSTGTRISNRTGLVQSGVYCTSARSTGTCSPRVSSSTGLVDASVARLQCIGVQCHRGNQSQTDTKQSCTCAFHFKSSQ